MKKGRSARLFSNKMWAVLPVAAMPLLHSTADRNAKGLIATLHRQLIYYTKKPPISQDNSRKRSKEFFILFSPKHQDAEHPTPARADVYEKTDPIDFLESHPRDPAPEPHFQSYNPGLPCLFQMDTICPPRQICPLAEYDDYWR